MKLINLDTSRYKTTKRRGNLNLSAKVISLNNTRRVKDESFIRETIKECQKNIRYAIMDYEGEITEALEDFMQGLVSLSGRT